MPAAVLGTELKVVNAVQPCQVDWKLVPAVVLNAGNVTRELQPCHADWKLVPATVLTDGKVDTLLYRELFTPANLSLKSVLLLNSVGLFTSN